MLNIAELASLAKSLAGVVGDHVSQTVGQLRGEVEHLRKQLAEIPEPIPGPPGPPGQDAPSVDLSEIAALVLIPEPVPGQPGRDGDSVSVDEVRLMVAEAVALVSIPEPVPGQPGRDGDSVSVDEVRRMVAEAVALVRTPEDGRDAAALDILPSVDLSKSYPRGTYATHDGGLWRAHSTTSGARGWECIVDGIKSVEVQHDPADPRAIRVAVSKSSGGVVEQLICVPSMIYRGVFAPGQFATGDTVTWGGSLWHCDEPTCDKPGEAGSKGWTLAAKRGRDGRDGSNGRDLVRGAPL